MENSTQELKVESVSAINALDKATTLDAVNVNGSLKFAVNGEVDKSTLNLNTVKVYKVEGNVPVAFSATDLTLSTDKKTITLAAPASRYSKDTQYKVVLDGVKTTNDKEVAKYETTFKTTNEAVVSNIFSKDLGSTDIRANDINKVTYDTFLSSATVNTSNVTVTDIATGKRVAIEASLNADNVNVDIKLLENLTKGKKYKLEINNLKTATGYDAENYVFEFTADANIPAPGTVKTLTESNIASQAVWGKVNSGTDLAGNYYAGLEIQVPYNEKLDSATVNNTTVYLQDKKTEAKVPATVTYNADAKMVKIVPNADLAEATEYTIVLSKNIKSEVGTSQAADVKTDFTTLDLTAPVVSEVTSVNGNTGLELGKTQKLNVKFSEKVDNFRGATNSTLTGKEFAIVKVGANLSSLSNSDVISATAALKQGSTTEYEVTFTPQEKDRNATYQLVIFGKGSTVGSIVTDNTTTNPVTLKNQLQANYSYTFTTEGADVTAPKIDKAVVGGNANSTTNIEGATAVATTKDVFFKFNEKINVAGTPVGLKFTDGVEQVALAAVTGTPTATAAAKDATSITVSSDTNIAVGDIVEFGGVYAIVKAKPGSNALTLVNPLSAAVANTTPVKVVQGVTVSDAATDAKTLAVDLATIKGGAAVDVDKNYTLTLTDGITDVYGNKITKSEYKFTTGTAPVVAKIKTVADKTVDANVLYSALNGNGTDANLDTAIPEKAALAVQLTDAGETGILASSVNADTVKLQDAAGNVVAATVTYVAKAANDTTDGYAVIKPSENLKASTSYKVVVSGVKDVAGNVAADTTYTFSTAYKAQPLAVTGTSIANNATNVARDSKITVKFNEKIDAASATPAAFELKAVGGAAIAVTTSVVGDNVILTPATPMLADTVYTLTVKKSTVKNGTSNTLANDSTITFRTASTTSTAAQYVEHFTITNGAAVADDKLGTPSTSMSTVATAGSVSDDLVIKFNKDNMDVSSATAQLVNVSDSNKALDVLNVKILGNSPGVKDSVVVDPVLDLATGQTYKLTLTDVKDVDGNTVPSTVVFFKAP